MLAGARAVQIGSAVATKGIGIFKDVVRGIEQYLDSNGFKSVEEIVGSAHGKTNS
jgi:dihydroorotate dehydrogenase (NAD+) catalytic subunit